MNRQGEMIRDAEMGNIERVSQERAAMMQQQQAIGSVVFVTRSSGGEGNSKMTLANDG